MVSWYIHVECITRRKLLLQFMFFAQRNDQLGLLMRDFNASCREDQSCIKNIDLIGYLFVFKFIFYAMQVELKVDYLRILMFITKQYHPKIMFKDDLGGCTVMQLFYEGKYYGSLVYMHHKNKGYCCNCCLLLLGVVNKGY